MGPIDIGSRLELMVDDHLIARMSGGAALHLHRPTPRQVVLLTEKPWEGNMCGYITVFQDGEKYRMYYKAEDVVLGKGKMTETHDIFTAYAESNDGINWERPELGLFEYDGSRSNNIVWPAQGGDGRGAHGFAPFKDTSPECRPEARYKAVGAGPFGTKEALYAMVSPDGVRWSLMQQEPIVSDGAFDSQNLAFRDSVRGEYRAYVRDFRDGRRGIRTATSDDFIHWTEPQWLEYPSAPDEQLYTNQIIPYYRAPHIFLGFPTRYVERRWSAAVEDLPELEHRRLRSAASERYGAALTDGLFMSSRDGKTFKRWGEAFIRPGLRLADNWTYGDNYQNWGIVETRSDLTGAPDELSLYVTEGYWRGNATSFRRYTLRVDGFVSVQAPLSGGEIITKPLTFEGRELVLNFSASAAGSVRVEILAGSADTAVEGLALDDCVEILGDDLERTVRWSGGSDVSRLAGTPVRLRFVLRDADLYSFRFR